MYQKAFYILGGKDFDFKDGSLLNIIQLGKASGNTSLKFGCRLSPNQGESMLMIIEVLAQAEQYYGNNAAALKWLNTPNLQLYNETPLNYLDTVIGIKLVSEELNKLSHGMTA
jgi:putative toxin-antitoxin system antitoxin component (TIGR02293 family)